MAPSGRAFRPTRAPAPVGTRGFRERSESLEARGSAGAHGVPGPGPGRHGLHRGGPGDSGFTGCVIGGLSTSAGVGRRSGIDDASILQAPTPRLAECLQESFGVDRFDIAIDPFGVPS